MQQVLPVDGARRYEGDFPRAPQKGGFLETPWTELELARGNVPILGKPLPADAPVLASLMVTRDESKQLPEGTERNAKILRQAFNLPGRRHAHGFSGPGGKKAFHGVETMRFSDANEISHKRFVCSWPYPKR